jgi:F-type H+-transporting ATPase subunit c
MKTAKVLQLFVFVVVALLAMAVPVFAQESGATYALSGGGIGAGLGAGIAIVGAGYGFGRIGSAALEAMARQPEVAGRVFVPMIVIAALLEGATLFAVVVCLQLVSVARF